MNGPKHVAIILDGNRRFAKRLMAKPWEGHEFGAKKVEKLLGWCADLGITEVTLYAFSVDNFKRPKREFDFIMKLFREAFDKLSCSDELAKREIRINFLGRINMFPSDVVESMNAIMESTSSYSKYTVNFCMAYGGREEIVDAARKIAEDAVAGKVDPAEVDESTFQKYLYSSDFPDMIIRTGGEKRLSGFLLFQSSYSELFFLDKMWPEFEKSDLVGCIEDFKARERRFGK